ncbi:hypothetical protein KEJ34_06730 [Candidatus Bathyarchaeota archaeon]|nr:hypothetical protein [Candidatus Bathyarchaeota archaeon]
MGREVFFGTGYGGTHDQDAPMAIAALAILGEVARICGELGARLKYYTMRSYLVPVGQDLIKAGYLSASRPELYSPDLVVYTGEDQRAFMAAVMNYIAGEKPGAVLFFGATYWETINVLGTGAVVGSFQIAGTPRLYYQSIISCTADYCLLGDELYAAAAAITEDEPQISAIGAFDIIKAFLLILLVAGVISITLGFPLISILRGW